MRIVDNSPVLVKALVAPLALLVCFLAVGVSAYLTLSRSAHELKVLSRTELPKQSWVSELTYNIMTTHVQATRYVTWATNGVSSEVLDELGRDISSGLDMWRDQLTSFRLRRDLSPVEQSTIAELIDQWGKYQAAVGSTVEVGASDSLVASRLLILADTEFKSVAHQLLILSAVESNQTRLMSHEVVAAAETNKQLLAMGGLFGVLLGALMTIFVVRSIVAPIGAVTSALDQVSSGRTEGWIVPYGDRKDEIGKMVKAIAGFRENIERQQALIRTREGELEAQNVHFRAALANMSQGLSMFDAEHRLIICNDRYAQIYGLTQEQVRPGTPFRQVIEHRISNGIQYADSSPSEYLRERVAPVTAASDRIYELSTGRVISVARRPMPSGGWVTTHEDITERRRIECQITHMAHHDALTDLPNRVLLRERLEQFLAGGRRQDQHLSVLMLDLDRFKGVNDTLGHAAGDMLLKIVAERLRSCVRDTDTIARLGGDEFIILHSVADAGNEAATLAKRIVNLVSTPFDLNGHQARIGISIGIALAPGDGTTADELLKKVDLALYRSKSEGRGTYRFFEPEMDQCMQARRNLEHTVSAPVVPSLRRSFG